MKMNVGTVDRVIRVVIGLGILSLLYFLHGHLRYIGLVGLVPLGTGIVGICPLYSLLGISTCKMK